MPEMIGSEGMTADEAVLEGAVETVQSEATDDAELFAGMPDLIDQEYEDSDGNRDDNAEPEQTAEVQQEPQQESSRPGRANAGKRQWDDSGYSSTSALREG